MIFVNLLNETDDFMQDFPRLFFLLLLLSEPQEHLGGEEFPLDKNLLDFKLGLLIYSDVGTYIHACIRIPTVLIQVIIKVFFFSS